jgi:NAD(P)-dependent dehydrogenase (short-subunit alcohol dehydrogenase family)
MRGKAIIVTGAAQGIGQATALALASEGANLVLVDLTIAALEDTQAKVRSMGVEAISVAVDVSQESQVATMVAKAVSAFERVDGAFNNAGVIQSNKRLHELDERDWKRVIDVNLRGVFFCMKHEISAMLKDAKGSIVNTSSILGRAAILNSSEYAASKHAVIGLTKSAAVEYGTSGIRVNAILPGLIRTPLNAAQMDDPAFEHIPALIKRHALGRSGLPDEVAQAAVWLLSDKSSFVTGAEFTVDGGYLAS